MHANTSTHHSFICSIYEHALTHINTYIVHTYIHTYIPKVYPLLFDLVRRSDDRQLLLNGDIRCRDDIVSLKSLLFQR